MKRLTALIFRFRSWILAMFVVLTAFFGWQAMNLKVNGDVLDSLPKDDPVAVTFREVDTKFSGGSIALVVMECGDVFTPEAIGWIDQLTRAIKNTEGIISVSSLTDILDIRKGADGTVEMGKLIDPDDLPRGKAQLARLRSYVHSKDLYVGRFVSQDDQMAVMIVRMDPGMDKPKCADNIREAALGLKAPYKIYFGGNPFITNDIYRSIVKDVYVLMPIVLALMITLLYTSFGTIRGVVVPLSVAGIAVVWTMGLMGFGGFQMTLISNIIPVLLIAIGTAPAIHILSKYDESLTRYGSRGPEAREAFTEVGLRVFLTGLTIVFGFSSFISGSYLVMIKEFGLFTAIGAFFVLVVALLAVPAALTFLHPSKAGKSSGKASRLDALTRPFFGAVVRNPRKTIAIGLVLLAISSIGAFKVERKSNIIEFFKEDSEPRKADDVLTKGFGGSLAVQIDVIGDMTDPVVLGEMRHMGKFMDSLDGVGQAGSVSDLVAELNEMMVDTQRIPDSQAKVANLWFMLEGQEMLSQMVTEDRSEGIIQSMLLKMDSVENRKTINSIDGYIAGLPKSMVTVKLASLKPAGRKEALRYHAGRVADDIIWDVKRRTNADIDAKAVAEKLYEMAPRNPAGSGSVAQLWNAIRPMIPPESLKNIHLMKDIKGDLEPLGDSRIAVPEEMAKRLAGSAATPSSPVHFSMVQSGMHLITSRMNDSLLSSQVSSLGYAVLLIYILILLQMRSWVGGLISMVPIICTIIMAFGAMGFLHIPLDIATVVCASIALGIGIDYAIHTTVRFKSWRAEGGSTQLAVERTLATTGNAIIVNVLSLSVGFLTLIFSSVVPLQNLGFLVALTMILSGLGAVTMLPALILVTDGKFMGKSGDVSPTAPVPDSPGAKGE